MLTVKIHASLVKYFSNFSYPLPYFIVTVLYPGLLKRISTSPVQLKNVLSKGSMKKIIIIKESLINMITFLLGNLILH